jgi:hypothetical protein
MDPLLSTVTQLHASSVRKYINPYTYFDWPRSIDLQAWHMTPELVSLYGTDVWDSLDETLQRRLSFFETVNFFSLNVFGERQQMEGLARRLYEPDLAHVAEYLHHFLDEENKHNVVFAQFCLRYAGKLYPQVRLALPREHVPGEANLLFFARILIFEEIAVSFNAAIARDERVTPIARSINRYHYVEEVRHLRFGRAVVRDLWDRHSPTWSDEVVERIRSELAGFLTATWLEYYSAAAYRDAGLEDVLRLRAATVRHPAVRERRAALSASCVGFLTSIGILKEEIRL